MHYKEAISTIRSPHFTPRNSDEKIEYIVLHATEVDLRTSLDLLTDINAKNPVSCHYLITEEGEIYTLVAEENIAWHAGKSFWQGKTNLNATSLGIELVNLIGHPFAAKQIAALILLLKERMPQYKIPPQNLLAHSDIAPTRKQDPGPLFPWQTLANQGLGLFPAPHNLTKDRKGGPPSQDLLDTLQTIGYPITAPEATIKAFQRRYQPHKQGEGPDCQTAAYAKALAQNIKRNNLK